MCKFNTCHLYFFLEHAYMQAHTHMHAFSFFTNHLDTFNVKGQQWCRYFWLQIVSPLLMQKSLELCIFNIYIYHCILEAFSMTAKLSKLQKKLKNLNLQKTISQVKWYATSTLSQSKLEGTESCDTKSKLRYC